MNIDRHNTVWPHRFRVLCSYTAVVAVVFVVVAVAAAVVAAVFDCFFRHKAQAAIVGSTAFTTTWTRGGVASLSKTYIGGSLLECAEGKADKMCGRRCHYWEEEEKEDGKKKHPGTLHVQAL